MLFFCARPGFDTVTTALSWCMMYAALYPHIQKKIQAELGEFLSPLLQGWDLHRGLAPTISSCPHPTDQTIGRERRPRLSDRGMLPYTEAFILEMFRHSSFMPFTIPHRQVLGFQRGWRAKLDLMKSS